MWVVEALVWLVGVGLSMQPPRDQTGGVVAHRFDHVVCHGVVDRVADEVRATRPPELHAYAVAHRPRLVPVCVRRVGRQIVARKRHLGLKEHEALVRLKKVQAIDRITIRSHPSLCL